MSDLLCCCWSDPAIVPISYLMRCRLLPVIIVIVGDSVDIHVGIFNLEAPVLTVLLHLLWPVVVTFDEWWRLVVFDTVLCWLFCICSSGDDTIWWWCVTLLIDFGVLIYIQFYRAWLLFDLQEFHSGVNSDWFDWYSDSGGDITGVFTMIDTFCVVVVLILLVDALFWFSVTTFMSLISLWLRYVITDSFYNGGVVPLHCWCTDLVVPYGDTVILCSVFCWFILLTLVMVPALRCVMPCWIAPDSGCSSHYAGGNYVVCIPVFDTFDAFPLTVLLLFDYTVIWAVGTFTIPCSLLLYCWYCWCRYCSYHIVIDTVTCYRWWLLMILTPIRLVGITGDSDRDSTTGDPVDLPDYIHSCWCVVIVIYYRRNYLWWRCYCSWYSWFIVFIVIVMQCGDLVNCSRLRLRCVVELPLIIVFIYCSSVLVRPAE